MDLVSEGKTKKLEGKDILHRVVKFFEWAMFSHTWEGDEPTFQDVNVVESIWKLEKTPLNEKLKTFCKIAREGGYRWVWSDTCCIDKSTSAVLSQSLISMYRWYADAATTLVYLSDILPSDSAGLTKSRWMTRAWTLQELLASKVVRFYDKNWQLYLDDTSTNHKESTVIKEELARAIGVKPETIASFLPEDLGVREKLRLAASRHATMEEDIAYSLIGIFSSDIVPRYGLGKEALGQLLEGIVARSGDLTVISWTGKPLLIYNSALPDSLAVYGRAPYSAPEMGNEELEARVGELRGRFSPKDCLDFYRTVVKLPRPSFLYRCLHLPCIAFSATKIILLQELGGTQGNLYHATVSLLGSVEFRTEDVVPMERPRKLVFVHPWLRDLRDSYDESASDDELDDEPSLGDTAEGNPTPTSSPSVEPKSQTGSYARALRLIARLGRPFNVLLLEQQPNDQYKRIAAENEIVIPGVPSQTNPRDIRAKVLEIV